MPSRLRSIPSTGEARAQVHPAPTDQSARSGRVLRERPAPLGQVHRLQCIYPGGDVYGVAALGSAFDARIAGEDALTTRDLIQRHPCMGEVRVLSGIHVCAHQRWDVNALRAGRNTLPALLAELYQSLETAFSQDDGKGIDLFAGRTAGVPDADEFLFRQFRDQHFPDGTVEFRVTEHFRSIDGKIM